MKNEYSVNKITSKGNVRSAFIDRVYKRGDIIEFFSTNNNGKSYRKLGVVVSKTKNNMKSKYLSVLLMVPGTTNYSNHAKIAYNYEPYCVLTEEVIRIDVKNIVNYLHRFNFNEMEQIDTALAYFLGLGKYVKQYEKPIRPEVVQSEILIFEDETAIQSANEEINSPGDDTDVS